MYILSDAEQSKLQGIAQALADVSQEYGFDVRLTAETTSQASIELIVQGKTFDLTFGDGECHISDGLKTVASARSHTPVMDRCRTCRHWEWAEYIGGGISTEHGDCGNPALEQHGAVGWENYERDFHPTGPDFGCVLHEPLTTQ